jgi:hypothetical protein
MSVAIFRGIPRFIGVAHGWCVVGSIIKKRPEHILAMWGTKIAREGRFMRRRHIRRIERAGHLSSEAAKKRRAIRAPAVLYAKDPSLT